jgi:hypothetical protein
MLVSAVGDGMSMVAVAWLAVQIAPPDQAGVWTGLAVAAYALPVHVAQELHGSAGLLGLYWAVFGVGATLGGLGAGLLRHRSLWLVVVSIVIGWGAALLPLGVTDLVGPGLAPP